MHLRGHQGAWATHWHLCSNTPRRWLAALQARTPRDLGEHLDAYLRHLRQKDMLQRLPLPVTDVRLSPRKQDPSAAPEKAATAPTAAKPEAKKEKAPEPPPKGACLPESPIPLKHRSDIPGASLSGTAWDRCPVLMCIGCCEVIQQPAHTMSVHHAPVNILSETATAPLQGLAALPAACLCPCGLFVQIHITAHLFDAAAHLQAGRTQFAAMQGVLLLSHFSLGRCFRHTPQNPAQSVQQAAPQLRQVDDPPIMCCVCTLLTTLTCFACRARTAIAGRPGGAQGAVWRRHRTGRGSRCEGRERASWAQAVGPSPGYR